MAGGRSKFVCIYEVSQQLLIRKFQISKNRSFDGMQVNTRIKVHLPLSYISQPYLNSAKMSEAGPLDLLEVDSDSDKEDLSLPGVLKGKYSVRWGRVTSTIAGDMSSRKTRPQVRTKCVQFSPTGWFVVTGYKVTF